MTKQSRQNVVSDPITTLLQNNFLFAPLGQAELEGYLQDNPIAREKLYSNRPIYTAFRPDDWLEYLYIIIDGGPVIMRSTPLDRVIGITYPGGCFGHSSSPVGFGTAARAFPSLVEAYKTTDVTSLLHLVVLGTSCPKIRNFCIGHKLNSADFIKILCSVFVDSRLRRL